MVAQLKILTTCRPVESFDLFRRRLRSRTCWARKVAAKQHRVTARVLVEAFNSIRTRLPLVSVRTHELATELLFIATRKFVEAHESRSVLRPFLRPPLRRTVEVVTQLDDLATSVLVETFDRLVQTRSFLTPSTWASEIDAKLRLRTTNVLVVADNGIATGQFLPTFGALEVRTTLDFEAAGLSVLAQQRLVVGFFLPVRWTSKISTEMLLVATLLLRCPIQRVLLWLWGPPVGANEVPTPRCMGLTFV